MSVIETFGNFFVNQWGLIVIETVLSLRDATPRWFPGKSERRGTGSMTLFITSREENCAENETARRQLALEMRQATDHA